MSSFVRPAIVVSLILLPAVAAASEIGTRTITNAVHAGRRGATGNTVTAFTPNAAGGTIRRIDFAGSVTKAAGATFTWANEARVSPTLGGLATSQGWIQFTNVRDFDGTLPVSGTIYAPGGGITAASNYRFEHYDAVPDTTPPAADAFSTVTYSFNDSYGEHYTEYSAALTSTDPTYNRVFYTGAGFELSGLGTNVYYDLQPLHVATSGRYTMASASGFNNYLSLYENGFSATAPLQNVRAVDDFGVNVLRGTQFPNIPASADTSGTARIDFDLLAGVQYFLVTSSSENGQTGAYTNLLVGPGEITLGIIPEPAAAAVAGLAAGLLAFRRRPRWHR
jgi:hypothetical protein